MTAPADRARFEFLVEIYLGAVLGWVDITADVRGQVSITRGLSSEGKRANPGTCTLRLDNSSGDYSPRNPAGQWYGLIGRNTPLRVSAGLVGGTLVRRFHGEVSEWPARWSLDEVDRYVDVTASGILRRLDQGEQPAWSPLRRTIAATDPVAYWPGEEGDAASQAGAATADASPLIVSGTVDFTSSDDYAANGFRYGTSRLGDIAPGGSLRATLPAGAAAATQSAWTVHVFGQFDVATAAGDIVLMEWTTPGGTYTRWQLLVQKTALHTQVIGYTPAGVATVLVDRNGVLGGFRTWAVSAQQSGSLVNITYRLDDLAAVGASVTATLAGVTSVTVNPTGTTSTQPMPFGHVAVWDVADYSYGNVVTIDSYGGGVYPAYLSYRGEAATNRLTRVCAEQGIPLTMTAPPAAHVSRMGSQPVDAFRDLIDQVAAVDGGYLYEQRDALGLAYRTRASLYNQSPIPIAYIGQLGDPFDPVDDDSQVVNDVTVKRTDGSSARAVQTTGPLAAVPPPAGVGVYRTEVELNLGDDGQLADQAWWRVHLGTVNRPRYPALSVQLADPAWDADPSGVADLLAVDTGDVLEVTGLPTWAAGDARTLVLGYTETFDEWLWSITFAGVPAQPWDVAEVDGEARYAGDGCTLTAAITAPLPVTVWDFTASSGLLGWAALNGSVAIVGGALLFTPNGVATSPECRSPMVAGATAGKTYAGSARATCAVTRTVTPFLLWRDASGTLLGSSGGTPVAMTAGVPADLYVSAVAPAGTTQVGLSLIEGSTPPASHTLSVDVAALGEQETLQITSPTANGPWTTKAANFPLDVRVGEERIRLSGITGASSPQTATVAAGGRAINGVSAGWPTGTEVDVWRPAVVAL